MKLKPIFFVVAAFVMLMSDQTYLCAGQYYSEVDQYLYPQRQKTISMDLKGANLNDVLKMFSQQSGMNFIATSEVSGQTVNLYLDHVPVEEALERILAANNLTYELQNGGNIFLVKKLTRPNIELISRVYPLKHATIPSSKINSTLSDFESAGKSAAIGNDREGIVSAIKAVLSDNGRVIEYARTNSLVITDIPSQFDLIERTIKRLDIRVPQILIEVEMLDISKNTSELLGAKWGDSPLAFTGGSKRGLFPFDFDNIIEDNIQQSNRIAGASTEFLEEQDLGEKDARYTASNVSFEGLTFILQFLRTQTDTRSLARPRILTLNNETAEIRISTDEAIGLESSVTGADAGTEATTEAERANTGVILTVTPQANLVTGEIVMAIEPKVIQASSATGFVGAENFQNTEERGSKSILRVTDGDTIILGGLLRSEVSDIRQHVPIISKLPILGAAFRHKDKSEEERELIIFITPQILEENYTNEFSSKKPRTIVREREKNLSYREENVDRELTFIEGKY